ncbi:MAG: hypothetical protein JW867_04285 [Candidatus Omnitrophica bacterium]|nr:hypothetical protein [Candidatus Omnitrophota bacterium]
MREWLIELVILNILLLAGIGSLSAETIILKTGKSLDADINERTDEYIIVDFQGIPLKYSLADIDTIDGKKQAITQKPETEMPSVDKYAQETSGILEGVYSAYIKALENNNMQSLKEVTCIAALKGFDLMADRLGGMNEAFSAALLLAPKNANFYQEDFEDEEATLSGYSEVYGQKTDLVITFKKEGKQWKVDEVKISKPD